jgi:hypothetical protein
MTPEGLVSIILTGLGATAVTDAWTLLRQRLFAIPPPNYALVGRWIAQMAHGRFCHVSISAAPKARAERAIGWTTHYLIGVAFAGLLALFCDADWFRHPTPAPALITGIATVVAPFFVMQPAMGAGIAASRAARPNMARFHSVVMHAVFGLGLYAAAKLFSVLSTGG